MAARRRNKNPPRQSSSAYINIDSIQVPYIGEDGKLYVSHQPKISPARRPRKPSKTPEVMPVPKSGYTLSEMIETFELRQKKHEAELCRPSQLPAAPRHGSRNRITEEKICFIARRFVSLGGALLGHFEELAMGELPEASQKTDFALLIREYSTAKSVMHGLIHEQTSNCLALQQLNCWLIDLLQPFLHTSFGQSYAGLIPARDLLDPTQSLGPDPAVEYMQQTLQTCLVYITDRAASSKDIGELLSLQAILKAALPPSISQSIVHYIKALVNSVCDHIACRAAAIRPALKSRYAH